MSTAQEKMRAEGLADIAVETFAHYEQLLRDGDLGVIRESEIEPLTELPDAGELPPADDAVLDQAVVLKLNGGLGTSMGMTRAKSLIEVKEGLSFLDIIVRQVLHLRERHGASVPLMLMNSFATQDDTLAALERYPELAVDGLPLDFVQGKVPKLLEDVLRAGRVAGRPGAGVGAAGARGRVRVAGDLRHARRAAGARVPLPVPVELGQPGRGARSAHPGLVRRRGAAVPVGVDRPHGVGPQGRPPGAAARRRRPGAARDGTDDRRGRRGLRGHRAAPVLQLQQHLGGPGGAAADAGGARRGAGAADDREQQDRRPNRLVLAGRAAARDGDGSGDRGVRRGGGAAGATHALRAGEDDQPAAGGAVRRVLAGGGLDGAGGRRSAPAGVARFGLLQADRATSTHASRRGRRRCANAAGWRSAATSLSAAI